MGERGEGRWGGGEGVTEEGEKPKGKKSAGQRPIVLSKSNKRLVLSRSHTETVPLSCRSPLYQCWPASFHCLRLARSYTPSVSRSLSLSR